jgi:hypothetical protein
MKGNSMLDNISAADMRHLTDAIADSFDATASACDAAGLGQHITHGHAAVARKMAAHIRSESALGRVAHRFDDSALHAAADEPAKFDAYTTSILNQFR